MTTDDVNECDFCGDDFPSTEALKYHISIHHPTSSNIKETSQFGEKVIEKQCVKENRSGQEKEKQLTDTKQANDFHSKIEMISSEILSKKTESDNFDQQKFIAEGLVNNFANAIKDADKNTKVMAIAMLQKTNPDLVSKKVQEKINVDDFKKILKETGMSQRKLFAVMSQLRKKWGQKVFEPSIMTKVGILWFYGMAG